MIFKFLEFLQSIKKLILWIAHYTIQLLYINLNSLVCHNMLMVGEVVVGGESCSLCQRQDSTDQCKTQWRE